MKLLNITTKYFLVLLLTILTLWTAVFYFVIKNKISENVDEFLDNKKLEIVRETESNPGLLNWKLSYKSDFKIEKITPQEADTIKEHFSKIWILEPLENDLEPYRQLTTSFSNKQGYFKLTITTSLVESNELIGTILITVILLYLVLVISVAYLNRKLLQKLWQPFYSTLNQVKKYRLEQHRSINFDSTNVVEFRELNETISQLIKNNLQSYRNQKQFIENASHEIQTPLAIAGNKAELLMENPDLTAGQAELIDSITENLNRLSRLNKSLLLLSKIQNNQFPETEKIDIEATIKRIFNDLDELIEFKRITFKPVSKGKAVVKMNPDLAEILFGNLVRNAIHHNTENGFIHLIIRDNGIVIENSSLPFKGDTDHLFERFIKNSNNKNSYGLGLAIVKSICDFYHFTISYTIQKNIHKIILQF
ncbi:MAG: HAMP domain-containing histidine kinase [Calditrichaeota bacterium]|nr:HAMP domain-containing histidine kinase [Calditrichota bacterium]